MNLTFRKIYIKGFQSVENISVELDEQGVVIVKGINNYEQNVKSNGSGKSSIFESIVFALYGETSSGIKDPENRVLNQGYEVDLYVNINGTDYIIKRLKSGGKATVELWQEAGELAGNISGRNKTDTDKMIQNILGISKDIFLDSVFLAQGVSTNLSTLSPTARKERLEILTGTEKLIEDFKTYIKNKQLEYEANCTELTMNKTKIEGNIQSLEGQISTLNYKINEINIENERKKQLGNVAEIEQQINDIKNNIEIITLDTKNLEGSTDSKQSKINEYRAELNKVQEEKDNINEELNKQRDVVYQINTKMDNEQSEINTHQKDISRIEKEIETIRNSDRCPTCGRKYDDANEEHIQQTISKYNDEIQQHKEEIQKLEYQIEADNNDLSMETEKGKKIREGYDSKQNRIQEINTLISSAENELSGINNSIKSKRADIESKQTQLDTLYKKKEELLKVEIQSTAEYENMIADAEKKIKDFNVEINSLVQQWNKQNDLVDVCKYSQQLITKPFRTYLLQNSIKILNEKLNYLSKKLFSNSKDVITVDGDDSKLDIKLGDATYESLSGGEKTRVNMCLLLAQKYLASSLGNIDCNIIVLDEVLGQCDSEAEMNIIDLIVEELQSVSSIIFIGHKELPIPNDSIITVVKDERGLSNLL